MNKEEGKLEHIFLLDWGFHKLKSSKPVGATVGAAEAVKRASTDWGQTVELYWLATRSMSYER